MLAVFVSGVVIFQVNFQDISHILKTIVIINSFENYLKYPKLQTWCNAITLWKINQLTEEFTDWKKQEIQLFDEMNNDNESVHTSEEELNSKELSNSMPLVFDVPIVPAKINDDIFHQSTGILNLTALRLVVRQLNIENGDALK